MRLGFHGATTMTSNLETDIDVTHRAGFKYLELWQEKIETYLQNHTLADLSALLKSNDVTPLSINSLGFVAFWSPEEYKALLERTRRMSEIAQAINCPTIVAIPSPIPNHQVSWAAIVDEHVRVLKDLSDLCTPYGVRISFEFLGFGWCTVRTPRGCWEIVQKTNRANVGMTVDCAHFHTGGGLLDEIDLIDPAKIFAFHLDDLEDIPKEAITDGSRLLPGLGVIPLNAVIERIKNIGYDGSCSIELFREEYWAWDPLRLATASRDAALKVLKPFFQIQ
jgi:2-keto-myo-inositol isomerase